MTAPKTPSDPILLDDLSFITSDAAPSLDDLAVDDLGDLSDLGAEEQLSVVDLGDLAIDHNLSMEDLGDLSLEDISELGDLQFHDPVEVLSPPPLALSVDGDAFISQDLAVSSGAPPSAAPAPPAAAGAAADAVLLDLRQKLRRRDLTIQALRRDLALLQLNEQENQRANASLRDLERERDALRDLESTHLQSIRRLQEECEVLREIEQTQQETIDRIQDRNDELRKQNERLTAQLAQRASSDQPDVAALQQQVQDLNARFAFKRDEYTQHVETLEGEHARKQERLRAEIERLRAERDLSQQTLFELRASLEAQLRALNGLLQTNPEAV
jgi:hypothetical protein